MVMDTTIFFWHSSLVVVFCSGWQRVQVRQGKRHAKRERAPAHRAVVHAGLQAADRDHTGVRDACQGRQQHQGSGAAAGHAAPVKRQQRERLALCRTP